MQHDDDELFLGNGWQTKSDKPYFQPAQLSEILSIANLPHPEYEPVQNLGPEFVEWSSILLITSTQECHKWENRQECNMKRMQHEKSATWKKYNIKKSVTWKECNIILVQHKAAQHKNKAT